MSQIVLDMACVLLPEPTNEPNCSGYGLRALNLANQWAKLFWLWLACSYLSQLISQIVLDMAGVTLPEPTNEPNCSGYGWRDLTWANQWAKVFGIWLTCSYLGQSMNQIVLDMACMLLPEPTIEPNCSGYGLRALTWANQWAQLFRMWLAWS
jgi:putative component of membrane protein insertase Oxa1/YidC/SpoIIIJ protein YidD